MLTWPPIVRIVFFFQAKDGIRDHCVTGVQTCALPISHDLHENLIRLAALEQFHDRNAQPFLEDLARLGGENPPADIRAVAGIGEERDEPPVFENRSEERRVGKECRSRWWAYHVKNRKR